MMGQKFLQLYLVVIILIHGSSTLATSYDSTNASELSFAKLVELISENQLTSIEQVLERLKQDRPDYFQNYVLMYHSRSIQGSSFEAPRVLLFDQSGQFVFTFNGDRQQKGFNSLETMEFDSSTNKFTFHEIQFQKNRPPIFSEANPVKCMGCHQSPDRTNIDPRPNWEPYSTWPGAYGSMGGDLDVGTYDKKIMDLLEFDPLMRSNAFKEAAELENFVKNIKPSHPRYKYLDNFDPELTLSLTEILAFLNLKRVTRILTQDYSEIFNKVRSTFLGAAFCEKFYVKPNQLDFLSKNWGEDEINGFQYKYNEKYGKAHRHHFERDENGRPIAIVESRPRKSKFAKVNFSEALHYIFAPFGAFNEDWSMDFKTRGRFAFYQRFGVPSNIIPLFRKAFNEVTNNQYETYDCNAMRDESLATMTQFMESQEFSQFLSAKKPQTRLTVDEELKRCIKCHTSRDYSIPQIAFDKPDEIKSLLKQRAPFSDKTLMEEIRYRLGDYAKESEQMPLGPNISNELRQQLLTYFETLNGSVRKNGTAKTY